MYRKDNHNLALHLTIIGFTMIIFFSSCTTTYYFKHYDYSSGEPESRYKITEKDLEQFSHTIRQHRQDPDSLYRQAIYFQRINKHKLALEALEKALLIDTTHVKAYNAMGVSYDKIGDYARAIEAYQRALKINPDNASVLNNLGYSYLLYGKTEAAVEAFQSAVALDNGTAKYHNNLATAYARKGLFDQALEEFILASGEARGHYNMAQIYLRMDRPNKAQYHLARAQEPTPSVNSASSSMDNTKRIAAKAPDIEKKQIDPPRADSSAPGADNFIVYKGEAKSVFAAAPNDKIKPDDHPAPAHPQENMFTVYQGDQTKNTEKSMPSLQTKSSQTAVSTAPEKTSAFSAAAITPMRLPDIRPYQSQLKVESTDEQPQPRARSFKVEISNGNGVNRMAKRVGDYLQGGGIEVTRLTNASHFNFSKTTIYYHNDYIQEAFDIAQQLPGLQLMQRASRFGWSNVKIRVLIGKDLIPHNWYFSKHTSLANRSKTIGKRQ